MLLVPMRKGITLEPEVLTALCWYTHSRGTILQVVICAATHLTSLVIYSRQTKMLLCPVPTSQDYGTASEPD